jgi:hypothetical protein
MNESSHFTPHHVVSGSQSGSASIADGGDHGSGVSSSHVSSSDHGSSSHGSSSHSSSQGSDHSGGHEAASAH